MRRALIQFALLVILVVWLGGPVFENVYPWDIFPDSGDNLVLMLTAAAVCFGAMLSLALLICRFFKPAGTVHVFPAPSATAPGHRPLPFHSLSFPSPQPLRI